jgi:protein involved in polysaccharide export with SLBB domain
MKRLLLLAGLSLLLAAPLPAALAQTETTTGATAATATTFTLPLPDPEATTATRIMPGCVLGILVTDTPALSGRFPVDADGNIRFVLTDDEGGNKQEWTVAVKDKTADEARGLVAESFKKYVIEPDVRLVIAKLPRLQVEIRGAAQKTGLLDLPNKAHLSDALAACEYTSKADLANIVVTRHVQADAPAGVKTHPRTSAFTVDMLAFQKGDSDDDPTLEPGDVVMLPALPEKPANADLRLIRVRGEVNRECDIPFGTGMKVSDAFNRAGGLTPYADHAAVHLIRGADGKIYDLNADRVEANDPVYNLALAPGDVILVGKRDRSLQYAVLGEVVKPCTRAWDPKQKVTVTQALEQAGGISKQGDRHKGILRKGYLIQPTAAHDVAFDLDQIIKGKQPDYEIDAGDAVIILPKVHRPSVWQQIVPWVFRFLPFGL